jgi:Uma2 family endonuclease
MAVLTIVRAPRNWRVPMNGPAWRWSVRRYHALIEAGILTENDPVELLEGELVTKMPKNPPHESTRRFFRKALEGFVPKSHFLDDQAPVTTSDSEPEPDLVVVRGSIDDYENRHPGPRDVALVIEVADSSLQNDREQKQRIYARAGIPVYWVVNLVDVQVEVYTSPVKGRKPAFQRCEIYRPGDCVPVVVDGKEVGRLKVADLLPRKR